MSPSSRWTAEQVRKTAAHAAANGLPTRKEAAVFVERLLKNQDEHGERIRALEDVLAFYADTQSYGINGGTSALIMGDAGKRAREVLR